MSTNEKKGVTVKINAELHAEVKKYIEERGITMGDFVTLALQDELHPKFNMEDKNMGNMRTLAFQVPEELFQKIKDYLQRAAMSETSTDVEEAADERTEQQNSAAVSNCEGVSEEVGEQHEEQESNNFSDDFDGVSEDAENPNENECLDKSEDQDEYEGMGMSMGM